MGPALRAPLEDKKNGTHCMGASFISQELVMLILALLILL
jgi:hypothetical protein